MPEHVCPYCQKEVGNKPLFEDREIYESDEMEKIVGIEKYGDKYSIEIETYAQTASAYMSIPINFCPICGRKLIDD